MSVIASIIRLISGLNSIVGRIFSWCALAIVLVCFSVVVLRYLFSTSYVWMQDLYVWLNGAMFTAVAGFALMRDEHVRVDIFYRHAGIKRKALADIVGALVFLLPFAVIVLMYSGPFVQRSWRYLEASANVGGMQGLFILKTFIIVFALLLGLQGIAMILRSVLILGGREDLVPEEVRYGNHSDDTTGTEGAPV